MDHRENWFLFVKPAVRGSRRRGRTICSDGGSAGKKGGKCTLNAKCFGTPARWFALARSSPRTEHGSKVNNTSRRRKHFHSHQPRCALDRAAPKPDTQHVSTQLRLGGVQPRTEASPHNRISHRNLSTSLRSIGLRWTELNKASCGGGNCNSKLKPKTTTQPHAWNATSSNSSDTNAVGVQSICNASGNSKQRTTSTALAPEMAMKMELALEMELVSEVTLAPEMALKMELALEMELVFEVTLALVMEVALEMELALEMVLDMD